MQDFEEAVGESIASGSPSYQMVAGVFPFLEILVFTRF